MAECAEPAVEASASPLQCRANTLNGVFDRRVSGYLQAEVSRNLVDACWIQRNTSGVNGGNDLLGPPDFFGQVGAGQEPALEPTQ